MNSHSRDIRWGNDKKVMIINVKCVGKKKKPQTGGNVQIIQLNNQYLRLKI